MKPIKFWSDGVEIYGFWKETFAKVREPINDNKVVVFIYESDGTYRGFFPITIKECIRLIELDNKKGIPY